MGKINIGVKNEKKEGKKDTNTKTAKDAGNKEKQHKTLFLFWKETKELIHLWIGESRIDTTPNHPFWIEGYGFREAGELRKAIRC